MNEYVLKDRHKLEFVNSIKLCKDEINVEYGNKDELALVFKSLINAYSARALAWYPCSHEIVVTLRTYEHGTYTYRELG